MALSLGVTSIVLLALIGALAFERLRRLLSSKPWRRESAVATYDPGRELRAEQRARELLRSVVNDEEWEMYRDLGFIRVWGSLRGAPTRDGSKLGDATTGAAAGKAAEADYAYLIYPHRPIVAYLPLTDALLNEYCVAFPDQSAPYGSTRLPASDDVLAKWMAIRADERHLISEANMHLPGRQIDPEMVRRDLGRLARWERERLRVPQRAAIRDAIEPGSSIVPRA
jgi:hypothetical protein